MSAMMVKHQLQAIQLSKSVVSLEIFLSHPPLKGSCSSEVLINTSDG